MYSYGTRPGFYGNAQIKCHRCGKDNHVSLKSPDYTGRGAGFHCHACDYSWVDNSDTALSISDQARSQSQANALSYHKGRNNE